MDEKKDISFFIDHLSVKNFYSVDSVKTLHSVGASVELPYIKHTNTMPYRVINENRWRLIDVNNNELKFHNGSMVQEVCPVNIDSKFNHSYELINDSMCFTHDIDFDESNISMEPINEPLLTTRSKMMHMVETFDHNKVYPTHEPVVSKEFKQQNGLSYNVHLPPQGYVTSWVHDQDDKSNRYNFIDSLGVSIEAGEYTALSHRFFNKYSRCRLGDFKNSGIHLSFDGVRAPNHLTFDMDMKLLFIVKKPEKDGINQTTHSSIQCTKQDMSLVKDASDPFNLFDLNNN